MKYLFEIKGKTDIAGVVATSTHVFRADEGTAAVVLASVDCDADLRLCIAREMMGVQITGADLYNELPYLADALSEEIHMDDERTQYYKPVDISDLSLAQIDALLGVMLASVSMEDATPEDPYYFSAYLMARQICSRKDLPFAPRDILR